MISSSSNAVHLPPRDTGLVPSETPAPDINHVIEYLQGGFSDLQKRSTESEISLFYSPEGDLPNGACFATLTKIPPAADEESALFRLSIGLEKETFTQLLGPIPKRQETRLLSTPVLDQLLPHADYAWMGWICIFNPSEDSLRKMQPLFEEAYVRSIAEHERRHEHA